MELWAKPTTLTGASWYYLAGRGASGTTNRNYSLYVNGDGTLYLATYSGTTLQGLKTDAGVMAAGKWTHVVATYDGFVARIYVNGQVVAENYGWGVVNSAATTPFIVGNSFNADGAIGFVGAMSEVALYSGALSGARVAAHFAAAAPSSTSPTPPQAVFANGDIVLTWAAPANTGGWPITGYMVEYMTPGSTTWATLVVNTGTTDTNYRLPGVVQSATGQGYKFRISAITQLGTGAASAPVGPIATSAVPTAPTSLGAAPGLASVALTWAAPVSLGGLALNGYKIERSSDGVTWTTLVASQTALTYTATGLAGGGSYYFRVTAFTDVGYGAMATVVAGPLGAISGLVATPGNASIALSWSAPSGGGAAPTGYLIQYRLSGAGTWTTATAVSGAPTGTTTSGLNFSVTGLTNGSLYDFQIIPESGSPVVAGPASLVSATPVAIVPITVLLATAASSDAQVALSWLAPQLPTGTLVTGYTVEQCALGSACTTTSTNFTTIATLNSGTRTVNATGLTNGTLMTFRITPILAGGAVVAGPVLLTATPLATAGSPTNLTATGGVQSVTLNWTAPSVSAGISISGYLIEYSQNNGAQWLIAVASTPTASTNYVVTGLTAGTPYAFRVSAVTSQGTGRSSTAASATPYAPPGSPTSLVGTAGDGSAVLKWVAPISNGGPAITGYRVELSLDGGTSWTAQPDLGNVLTTTVTGLDNGVPAQFRVTALTSTGQSLPSSAVSVTPFTAADAPTSLVATPGNSQVTLNWVSPTNTGGFAITGYRIETSTDGVTWTAAIANTGTNALTAIVTGLVNGTSYRFRLAALTGAGTGTMATPAIATPFGVPSAPRTFVGVSADAGVVLTWTAPASNGGSVITDYRVDVSTDGGATWTVAKASTSGALSASIIGLTNGTALSFRVVAINSAGAGAPATAISVTPYGLPDAPPTLNVVAGNAAVTLSWTAPVVTGGSSVSGYKIEQSADGGTTWTVVNVNTGSTTTSAVVSGLTNGTAYSFRVSAITRGGTSAPSATAGATPATTPGSPTSVTASPGDRQVTVTWAPPTDNGGSAVTSYKVERSADGGRTWTTVIASTTDLSVLDTGAPGTLTNGTLYVYRVTATNVMGAGAPTLPTYAIPAARADAPSNLAAVPGSLQVVLTWTPPTNTGGAPITGYEVD